MMIGGFRRPVDPSMPWTSLPQIPADPDLDEDFLGRNPRPGNLAYLKAVIFGQQEGFHQGVFQQEGRGPFDLHECRRRRRGQAWPTSRARRRVSPLRQPATVDGSLAVANPAHRSTGLLARYANPRTVARVSWPVTPTPREPRAPPVTPTPHLPGLLAVTPTRAHRRVSSLGQPRANRSTGLLARCASPARTGRRLPTEPAPGGDRGAGDQLGRFPWDERALT